MIKIVLSEWRFVVIVIILIVECMNRSILDHQWKGESIGGLFCPSIGIMDAHS